MALIFNTVIMDIAVVLLCFFAFVYVYFRQKFSHWKKRNVPYIEPSFPCGNMGDVIMGKQNMAIIFSDIAKKLQGQKFGGAYMFNFPLFICLDPDLIKDVLVKDFSTFHDRGLYVNEEVELLHNHLFFLTGDKWRNLRVRLSPTFTSGKMKMMFQTLVDCGDELKDLLKDVAIEGCAVEIKEYLARFATDVIASCAFGVQCNSMKNPDAEFRKYGKRIFEPSFKKIVLEIMSAVAPGILRTFKISRIDQDLSDFFINMVRETMEYREKNNIKRNDFLQLLIQLKNKGTVDDDGDEKINPDMSKDNMHAQQKLSLELLAAQAFVFYLGGFETSSTAMMFSLYELALNPDIQDRLQDEIDTVLQNHDGKVTYEAIKEMEYLNKVVSETLRKYPPFPALNRQCSKPYEVPGTDIVLEKGTMAVIPVGALHHDERYFPNPDRFDPERFTEEENAKRHPYVYLPFGEGPRICIGMRFGLMQTKVGLVSLLSKYQFSVTEKTPIPMVFDVNSFVLAPAGGMWLKISERS